MFKHVSKSILFSFCFLLNLIHAVEWYEEGEGGWITVNESIAPYNYTSYQNTGSVTSVLLDGTTVVGDDGDYVGSFYGDELRGIAAATLIPPIPGATYAGNNAFLVYLYSHFLIFPIISTYRG